MSGADKSSFREKLDKTHQWPSLYMFKFIVPKGKEDEVKQLFPKNILTEKPSRTGKYVSVTAKVMMASTDAVIDIYERASEIDELIAL
jgi:putative lipoic acid-binding regulatory protein